MRHLPNIVTLTYNTKNRIQQAHTNATEMKDFSKMDQLIENDPLQHNRSPQESTLGLSVKFTTASKMATDSIFCHILGLNHNKMSLMSLNIFLWGARNSFSTIFQH